MELVGIENSKITYLIKLHRPAGMLYEPEALEQIVRRYKFMKFPSVEELGKGTTRILGMGKFKEIQISELGIYNDGIIVNSASSSNLLDEFIDDLFGWSREEFGLIPAIGSTDEKTYESNLAVKSDHDLSKVLTPNPAAVAAVNKAYGSDRYPAVELAYSGFVFSVDDTTFPGIKKPIKFIVDRRVGVPVDQNIFYSQAPLATDDHLDVLRTFERVASSR